jgi:hypothetical protein
MNLLLLLFFSLTFSSFYLATFSLECQHCGYEYKGHKKVFGKKVPLLNDGGEGHPFVLELDYDDKEIGGGAFSKVSGKYFFRISTFSIIFVRFITPQSAIITN